MPSTTPRLLFNSVIIHGTVALLLYLDVKRHGAAHWANLIERDAEDTYRAMLVRLAFGNAISVQDRAEEFGN